jgi:serine/threonine protein kinase
MLLLYHRLNSQSVSSLLCSFIDDTGAVKVGDFGLSRECSDTTTNEAVESIINEASVFENGDITAGVGTRSYASPEQMKGGTDYDSSTDVYSLGIILFELCYPMYTVSFYRQ